MCDTSLEFKMSKLAVIDEAMVQTETVVNSDFQADLQLYSAE